MKQILSVLLACVLCTSAIANEWQCTRDGGVMFQSNRVIALPQDQAKTYCSVFYDPRDAQQAQVVRWFDENSQLADLKRKTHFAAIPSTSTMFAARYAGTVNSLPCIRLQTANGDTLCQMSGNRIPLSAEATASCIETTLRRNVQPSPYNIHLHYAVTPDEPDQPQPDKYVQPDVFDNGWPASRIWTLVIAGATSVLVGVSWQWKKSYEE